MKWGSSTSVEKYLGDSSPLCVLTSIQVSGYVRQTQQYLLKYIKNETLITRQVLELQFKYEP